MADIDPEVNIDDLHTAIKSRIAAAFPSFKTVEFYRDDEDELLPTPACLLALVDTEPTDDDAGTSQLPLLLRFEAHVIMAHRGESTRLAVRKAALSLAGWIHQKCRIPNSGAPRVIACEPDEFAPVADKFLAWRVEWVTKVFVGETAWDNDGTVPSDVLYSWAPKIGIGHEPDYVPLSESLP